MKSLKDIPTHLTHSRSFSLTHSRCHSHTYMLEYLKRKMSFLRSSNLTFDWMKDMFIHSHRQSHLHDLISNDYLQIILNRSILTFSSSFVFSDSKDISNLVSILIDIWRIESTYSINRCKLLRLVSSWIVSTKIFTENSIISIDQAQFLV